MRRRFPSLAQGGLTLIELMVALSIFAVLGVLSYRALSLAGTSQAVLDESFRRWGALARSVGRVETELLEIAMPKVDAAGPPLDVLRLAPGRADEIDFLRLDADLGVRRVGFRLREGRLEWVLWEGRETVGTPQREVLLENVSGLRWHVVADGLDFDTWPPDAAHRGRVPAAVVVDVDLPDLGSFHRVFALR